MNVVIITHFLNMRLHNIILTFSKTENSEKTFDLGEKDIYTKMKGINHI